MVSTLVLAAMIGSVPHPLKPLNTSIDVQSYDATMMIREPLSRRIDAASNTIILKRSSAADSVFAFHLRDLTIDSVTVNGQMSDVAAYGTPADTTYCHLVKLPPRTMPSTDTVHVYYHGTMTNEGGSFPWGGVHAEDSTLYALGVGFNNAYVSATQHWLPVLDHPGDKASYRLACTVPDGYRIASNGTLQGQPTSADGMSTFTWSMPEQCATYLLTIAVGRFAELDISGADTLSHVAYVLPRDSVAARTSLRLVPRMRRVFERWFGTYPFGKVGYVATQKGAMEHQTMISLNTSLVQRRDTVNMVAAHELAHQWWGDMVTPVDYSHVWLTESFATYCESLWTEDLQGFSAYLTSLDQRRSRYRSQIANNEGALPLMAFPRASPSSNYPETIYQKGAIILGMVRAWLGDSVFATGLRGYLEAHRHGNASTDDLRKALEAASGKDLATFFDQWIKQPGWPRLAVTMRRSANGWTATFTQVQQQQQPAWPRYETIPVAMTYREVGTNRAVDTVVVMGSEPFVLETADAGSVRVNAGLKGRSLVEVTTITSVADQPTASITLAPNPATSQVRLMTFKDHDAMDVTVIDMKGGVVIREPWPAGQSALTLSVVDLPIGIYVIRAADVALPLVVE